MSIKCGILILFFSATLQLFSDTILVGGIMEESKTWTNENTYIVFEDLIVPEGIILTIEQGVEVRINYARGITIDNGGLQVLGTQTNTVCFIPNHNNPGQIWKWKGILIINSIVEGEVHFNYAKVTDAETAIKLENSQNVIIENSSMLNCQNLGFHLVNSSYCSLIGCDIKNNYDGIEILTNAYRVSSHNTISHCIIRNQNHNIYIFREEYGNYHNNLIDMNIIDSGNNGIWISYIGEPINSKNTIKHNIIINNGANVGYGMYLAHDSTIVANNIFWKNNIALFCEQKADNCFINNNSFYQNDWTIAIGSGSENSKYLNNTFAMNSSILLGISETNNVLSNNNMLHSSKLENIVFNNTNVDFSMFDNYWGTTDTSIINRMIFDQHDNTVLGELNYVPYLIDADTSNPMAPPFKVIKQIVNNKVQVTWHPNQEIDLMGYQIYYGDYADYFFSDKNKIGDDTSYVFSEDVSIYDTIAVTAYDSVTTNINSQFTGNESPFAFAVIYPYAGVDTVICKYTEELDIVNSNIPMEYDSLFWSTSGDGIFNNSSIIHTTYFPGFLDYQNGDALLSLNVIVNEDTLVDFLTLSIIDNPVAFAGNDTTIIADSDVFLNKAVAENFYSVLWTTDGDGSFNFDTIVNPEYYPGNSDIESGIVHLEIMAYSNCGNSSDTITINIKPHYSVEGRLWVYQNTLNTGVIVAFREDSEGTRAIQIENAQNDGSFKFEKLMTGNYYLYALPDTNNSDNIVPCYYANDLRWQSAYKLPLTADVYDVDIHMPSTDFVLPVGEASISGHMEQPDDSKYSSDIYCMPWFENSTYDFCNNGLSNITVLLFNNTTTKLLDYTLTDEFGNFYFNQIPFGQYIVDAEKAGISSFPSPLITLSPEHKNESGVVLQISQQKIAISLDPESSNDLFITVFPNPASTEINIPYSNPLLLSSQLEIFDLFGNHVISYNIPITKTSSTIKLDIINLVPGLFFGRIINSNQIIHFRFVKG